MQISVGICVAEKIAETPLLVGEVHHLDVVAQLRILLGQGAQHFQSGQHAQSAVVGTTVGNRSRASWPWRCHNPGGPKGWLLRPDERSDRQPWPGGESSLGLPDLRERKGGGHNRHRPRPATDRCETWRRQCAENGLDPRVGSLSCAPSVLGPGHHHFSGAPGVEVTGPVDGQLLPGLAGVARAIELGAGGSVEDARFRRIGRQHVDTGPQGLG